MDAAFKVPLLAFGTDRALPVTAQVIVVAVAGAGQPLADTVGAPTYLVAFGTPPRLGAVCAESAAPPRQALARAGVPVALHVAGYHIEGRRRADRRGAIAAWARPARIADALAVHTVATVVAGDAVAEWASHSAPGAAIEFIADTRAIDGDAVHAANNARWTAPA